MKISDSAAQAFANFIEVMEQEHGIKIDSVSCWTHDQQDNADHAKKALDMADGKYDNNVPGIECIKPVTEYKVWGLADLDVYVYAYTSTIDQIVNEAMEEEDDEEYFFRCDRCDTDTHEDDKHSDVDKMCHDCGEVTMHEWEQENQQQQSDYERDRL